MKSQDKILSRRYAAAYIALNGEHAAIDLKAQKAAIAELEKVRLAAEPFKRFFLHPLVGADDKNEILARLLPAELRTGRASDFARLLMREKRFYLLDPVLHDCHSLYNEYAGVLEVEVVTRFPLTQEEENRFAAAFSSVTGRKAEIKTIIAERALGGAEVKVGDLLIDATMKGRLEKLKKTVLR